LEAVEVLSLAKRIAELDRVEAIRAQLIAYCARGVRVSARTLVRFDERQVADQKDLLQLEAVRIEESRSETELRAAYEQVERVLEEHNSNGEAHIQNLRENLNSTARVLQAVLTQMAGSGAAHHDALEHDLERLKEITRIDEIDRLKRELNETAAQIADRLTSMRREYQLIVTQLRDEIRTLHQELQDRAQSPSQRVASPGTPALLEAEPPVPEPASTTAPVLEPAEDALQGMKRAEFEEVLKVKSEQGEQYSLVVILLSNLADLFTKHDPAHVLTLMEIAARRVVDSFTGNPFWIRWEDDCFLVCTHYRGTAASSWAYSLAERLSGPQRLKTESGIAELPLGVAAAAVDCGPTDNPDALLKRASDLILTLRSAI
jgi:F0F1-type ATP synthase membrane subunit b/b'